MKKSMHRLIGIINRFNPKKIYIISNIIQSSEVYKRHLFHEADIAKDKIVILTKEMIIKDILVKADVIDQSIIILAGQWYLNRLMRSDRELLMNLIYKSFTIPIDELPLMDIKQ